MQVLPTLRTIWMWPNRTSRSTNDDETETTPGGLDAVSRSALADALTTIGDRWTLLVVAALLDGPKRFGDLQEDVQGIAPNVLTPAPAPARAERAGRGAAVLRAPAEVRVRAELGGP